MALLAEQVVCFGELRQATLLIVFQGIQRLLGRIHQGLRMGQPLVLTIKFIPLLGARGEFVDLANLPGQPFALALQAVLGGARFLQVFERGAPIAPGRLQGFAVNLGIGIQQAHDSVGTGQALPGMLAMNVEQVVCHFAQLGCGGRAAVDPGAAFALSVHGALEQQAVVVFKATFFQPNLYRGGRFKFNADLGACCAFPNGSGICPCAQGELQGIDQNGFASAGFARQHSEAAGQLQLYFAHDHKVAQADAFEAHATPSFQCSFLRRVS